MRDLLWGGTEHEATMSIQSKLNLASQSHLTCTTVFYTKGPQNQAHHADLDVKANILSNNINPWGQQLHPLQKQLRATCAKHVCNAKPRPAAAFFRKKLFQAKLFLLKKFRILKFQPKSSSFSLFMLKTSVGQLVPHPELS